MTPGESQVVQRIRRWPRRVLITIATIVVLLVGARIALPYVVKQQINARLEKIPGYVGHVDAVGISLWRGAYSLHGIAIYREEDKVREPFFLAKSIDFSIAWRELSRRKVVADFVVDSPQLIFVKGTTKEASTTDTDRRWEEVIQDVFPIDIQFLQVRNGLLRYIDKTRTPNVDVFLKNTKVMASGLRNRPDPNAKEDLPAEIYVEGETLGSGKLRVILNADPLAEQPHFHLGLKVDDVNLPSLNDSLKAYANVDVGRGTFRLAGEMAGKDGGFQGYMKPFFENLDFHNIEDKEKKITTRMWERIVAGVAWLVKNKSRDQVGTRIPFQGSFGSPTYGLWRTIANVFRHGFIRAFNPTVEGTLQADNVLPNGQSANGSNVANTKNDRATTGPGAALNERSDLDKDKAGAPTGRPSPPPKK